MLLKVEFQVKVKELIFLQLNHIFILLIRVKFFKAFIV